MSSVEILTQFKKNLVQFFDELIEQFPDESDFVRCRIFVKDQYHIQDLMNYFITDILSQKILIKGRDEKFFSEININKLDSLGEQNFEKNKACLLKKIWRGPTLSSQDREVIWKWIDTFVYLIEKYQKTLIK